MLQEALAPGMVSQSLFQQARPGTSGSWENLTLPWLGAVPAGPGAAAAGGLGLRLDPKP